MKFKILLIFNCMVAIIQGGCAATTSETLSALQKEKEVAALWNFDNTAKPQVFNGWSAELSSGAPRFTPGLHGQGVLIEENSRNLFAPAAAACTDAKAFEALRGATLSTEKNSELSILRVRTDGKAARQGVVAKTIFPSDETGAWAVASLQISGSGRVAVQLLDETNYVIGAPLYLDLTPDMQQISPSPIEIVVPGGELQLRVTSVDQTPTDFRMARLQIEPLQVATSWLPGGSIRPRETLEYTLRHDTSKLDEGTVFFWVKPNWNSRIDLTLMREQKKEVRTFFSLRNGTSGVTLFWILYNALGNGAKFVGAQNIYDKGWHFFALTWKGRKGEIYADGKSVATTISPIDPRSKFVFGPYTNAIFDEAVLLGTSLSKEELDKVFAAGKAVSPSTMP